MGSSASAHLFYGFAVSEEDEVLSRFVDSIDDARLCFALLKTGNVASIDEFIEEEHSFVDSDDYGDEVAEIFESLDFDYVACNNCNCAGDDGLMIGVRGAGDSACEYGPQVIDPKVLCLPKKAEIDLLIEFRDTVGFKTTTEQPVWLLGASYG